MGLFKFTGREKKSSSSASPGPVEGDAKESGSQVPRTGDKTADKTADKTVDKPAGAADAKPAEPVAAPVAAAAAGASQAPPVSAAGENGAAASRGSRLVEGGKARPADPLGTLRAKAAMAKVAAAAKPYRPQIATAATLALAAGLGFVGGTLASGRADRQGDAAIAAIAGSLAETKSDLIRKEGEIGTLTAEMKAIRVGMETIGTERDKVRGEATAKHAQLIERAERNAGENAARIARLAEALERLEKSREPTRLQGVAERLERVERSVQAALAAGAGPTPAAAPLATSAPASNSTAASSAPPSVVTSPVSNPSQVSVPTPPAKPDVAQTGSLGDAKGPKADPARPEPAKGETDPRRTPLEGYVIRDVEDGYALIETRTGRFVEVSAGQILPGIGRVEAVERRGRQWVVVTPRGFIGQRWN